MENLTFYILCQIHISKIPFLTGFTFPKSQFLTEFTHGESHILQNSHVENLILCQIHISKIPFLTGFTFSKSHFFDRIHTRRISHFTEFTRGESQCHNVTTSLPYHDKGRKSNALESWKKDITSNTSEASSLRSKKLDFQALGHHLVTAPDSGTRKDWQNWVENCPVECTLDALLKSSEASVASFSCFACFLNWSSVARKHLERHFPLHACLIIYCSN